MANQVHGHQEEKCAGKSIEGSEEGTQYCGLLTGECDGVERQAPCWPLKSL